MLQPVCITLGPREELGNYRVSPQSLLEKERAGVKSDAITSITCPGRLGLKCLPGECALCWNFLLRAGEVEDWRKTTVVQCGFPLERSRGRTMSPV